MERIVTDPDNNGNNSVKKNKNNNGSMIAVSYEARAASVRRGDRGLDAVKKCPDLVIVQVPVKHGKADLSIYRDASARVVAKLVEGIKLAQIFFQGKEEDRVIVEKASIDEIYVDVTAGAYSLASQLSESSGTTDHTFTGASENTTIGGLETANSVSLATNSLTKHEIRRGSSLQVLDSASRSLDDGSASWWAREQSIWSRDDISLACGAAIASSARKHVFDTLGFTLSAGISCNKTLAKLASGLKKPNRQTLVNPHDSFTLEKLFHPLAIDRIRGLGGKFGDEVKEIFEISTVGELAKIPLHDLKAKYPEQGEFLYTISRGICKEEVSNRVLNKSIGCGKTFRGANTIHIANKVLIRKWISELCGELSERLEYEEDEHQRIAKLFVLSLKLSDCIDWTKTVSRSCAWSRNIFTNIESALSLIDQIIAEHIQKDSSNQFSVITMSISGTNFLPIASGSSSILAAFDKQKQKETSSDNKNMYTQQSDQSRKIIFDNFPKKGHKKLSKRNVMKSWLSSTNSPIKKTQTLSNSKVYRISASEIDPDVLMELPEDVRKSVLAETSSSTKKPSKKGTLASFFK